MALSPKEISSIYHAMADPGVGRNLVTSINFLDGVTAGTASASQALVLDASSEIDAFTVNGTLTVSGASAFTGATSGLRWTGVSVKAANYPVVAADSGTLFIGNAADVVFTLPATINGLVFGFFTGVASAGTGTSVSPNADDRIFAKGISAEDDKDLINSGATDAVGDLVVLVGDGSFGWYMVEQLGTWAKEA